MDVQLEKSNKKPKHFIITGWQGKDRLWQAYWWYFALGNYVISKFLDFVRNLAPDNLYLNIAILVTVLAYLVWSTTAVWKCSFNTTKKYWGYIARIIVVITPIIGFMSEINK